MPSRKPLSKKIASTLLARVASASSTIKDSSTYKKVADAGSAIKNFFVGETSTYKTTADVLREEYKEIWGGTPPEDEAATAKTGLTGD